MTPTPDPISCRGLTPSGPDCPTKSPGGFPTVAPVEQTRDGAMGSGVDGLLGTVLDVLPWVLVALLLAVLVVLLVDRARRRPVPLALAPEPAATPARAVRSEAPPPAPSGAPPALAPAGLPPALVTDLITLADLATTPAVASQVRRVLRSAGVEPIEPAVGAPLDLDGHEVVATAPAPDAGHHERVALLHRPGWRCGSDVLRPAAVELWVLAPDRRATLTDPSGPPGPPGPSDPPVTPTLPR